MYIIYIFTNVHIYMDLYIYECIYVHMQTRMQTCTHTHIHTYPQIYIQYNLSGCLKNPVNGFSNYLYCNYKGFLLKTLSKGLLRVAKPF